jgi:5-methylcytosine-specific restriction endonuclease McrA
VSRANPYNNVAYQRNRRVVLDAAAYRCQMVAGCDRLATTVDHIVPVAYGGTNEIGNLRAACYLHNYQAGVKITNERRRGRRIGRPSRRWTPPVMPAASGSRRW